MATLGIIFALGAMIFWTIGDYSIQQSVRKVGDWETLFFIGVIGLIVLTPFVADDALFALKYQPQQFVLLLLLAILTLVAALFLFEALKQGKLSVIEPVFGIELPFAIAFSIVFGAEHLPFIFYLLSIAVFVGLVLVVTEKFHLFDVKKSAIEKGVVLALVGSILMGLVDFLTGVGSRISSPLITIWFIHSFLAIVCFAYLFVRGDGKKIVTNLIHHPFMISRMAIADNLAWICYAYSMVYLPIAIATTITESYIALAALLGIFLNKERLARHQILGGIIALSAVLILAYIST